MNKEVLVDASKHYMQLPLQLVNLSSHQDPGILGPHTLQEDEEGPH